MFQQDYVMRQIEMMTAAIARVFFKRETAFDYEIADEQHYTDDDLLYRLLCAMLAQGKINEAENMLFERLQPGNLNHLSIAMDFYRRIRFMDEKTLEQCNFSHEEALQGLSDIAMRFGMPWVV